MAHYKPTVKLIGVTKQHHGELTQQNSIHPSNTLIETLHLTREERTSIRLYLKRSKQQVIQEVSVFENLTITGVEETQSLNQLLNPLVKIYVN